METKLSSQYILTNNINDLETGINIGGYFNQVVFAEHILLSGFSAKWFEFCQVTLSYKRVLAEKFGMVHQITSPRERVGSGDDTKMCPFVGAGTGLAGPAMARPFSAEVEA